MTDLDAPELEADDRHHLERVLRLRAGEEITVSDGAGRWRPCRFGPHLEACGEVVRADPPRPAVAVALAPTKGDRPEWAVQKLTELGVDRIVLFSAARSVVRWEGDRAVAHVQRMERVAREAAMQSRRTVLPVVEAMATFDDLAGRPGAVLAEPGGDPPSLLHRLVLVGPEGGWSGTELDSGLPRVALGGHILRSETAAVTAGALLCALRSGLVSDTTRRLQA